MGLGLLGWLYQVDLVSECASSLAGVEVARLVRSG